MEEPSGFFNQYSETLPSFAQDFKWGLLKSAQELFDVTLAPDESASKSLEVTLALEDPLLGVLPDPDRRSKSHLIILTIENILFETSFCSGPSITPPYYRSKSDRTVTKFIK